MGGRITQMLLLENNEVGASFSLSFLSFPFLLWDLCSQNRNRRCTDCSGRQSPNH